MEALAWGVPRGWGGIDDGKEIRNEMPLTQHPCEDIFRGRQIPGVGEETEGKGRVGRE